MCAKLLILESPGKVKKVQEILGPGWKVAASVGMYAICLSWKWAWPLPTSSRSMFPRTEARMCCPAGRACEECGRGFSCHCPR